MGIFMLGILFSDSAIAVQPVILVSHRPLGAQNSRTRAVRRPIIKKATRRWLFKHSGRRRQLANNRQLGPLTTAVGHHGQCAILDIALFIK